jgi:hypothetical protein
MILRHYDATFLAIMLAVVSKTVTSTSFVTSKFCQNAQYRYIDVFDMLMSVVTGGLRFQTPSSIHKPPYIYIIRRQHRSRSVASSIGQLA